MLFGDKNADRKLQDFTDFGPKPLSILAYHNAMFEQVRVAFIAGAYYPALTGACALGERILNHLVLDLREELRAAPEYKRVYRKDSFDDWGVAIETLAAWDVLLPDVVEEFRNLATLRHRSIHFNKETYKSLREDAVTAVAHLRQVIARQFGAFGNQPWFIEKTPGVAFLKRQYVTHPFIRRYFLPQCPFVGVNHGIEFDDSGRHRVIDYSHYEGKSLSDEEYRDAYVGRDPELVAHG